MSLPTATTSNDISNLDRPDRPEALLHVFAQHLVWARESTLSSIAQRVESEEERSRLATAFRKPYDNAADLGESQRQAALKLVAVGVDSVLKEVLRILGNEGLDLKVSTSEAVRYRLDAELCSIGSGAVLASETISRGGPRFLPERWAEWLRRFRRR